MMIITCPCKKKKFKIDSSLIPIEGRELQCGSCEKVWFYKIPESTEVRLSDKQTIKENTINSSLNDETTKDKKNDIKVNFGSILFKGFSYLIILIITLIALFIILDTFKSPLNNIFPKLELFLFNLIETLKDIKFFIKDLII
tara:strand:- start:51 stop:476 length:426 start_codon:yes stop_codon:yes gene_type:complete